MVISEDGELVLGSDENTIIFILDAMDERYYEDFLIRQPEYVEMLGGFTHYKNAMASGVRTPIAVPSIFTGIPYLMKEPYSDYLSHVWKTNNA